MSPYAALIGLALLATTSANAADLRATAPVYTPVGALFVPPVSPVVVERAPFAAPVFPSPKVPGYYGRAGDFAYRNYYGTSPAVIFSRLPYACGFHGYC